MARRAVVSFAVAMAALALGPAPALAESVPTWLSCPDAATLSLRPDPDRDPVRIRTIAPGAGAVTSTEIYAHARFADLGYRLYAAFDAGQDPRTAFTEPGLTLVSLIYGTPGPNTERGPRPARTRTLYGVIADERASGRRYIIFRGTQEPAEWARNAQAGQRPFAAGSGARVHAGFMAIYDSLEIEDASGVTPFARSLPALVAGRQTVIVGHSLGGALATLAGVDASLRAPAEAARLRVVTLASPRVGDPGFAALASRVGRIDRVCNLVDVVPSVPPSTRQVTYVHVGRAHRVSSFDWPTLANDLSRPTDQLGCWHNHLAYGLMLNPAHRDRTPAQCFK